jgi:hypothetical protein
MVNERSPACGLITPRIDNITTAEASAGTAAAMNNRSLDQCSAMNWPASTGPTIAPIRPIPRLQPIPVDRSAVG